jgi:hypothetical protein
MNRISHGTSLGRASANDRERGNERLLGSDFLHPLPSNARIRPMAQRAGVAPNNPAAARRAARKEPEPDLKTMLAEVERKKEECRVAQHACKTSEALEAYVLLSSSSSSSNVHACTLLYCWIKVSFIRRIFLCRLRHFCVRFLLTDIPRCHRMQYMEILPLQEHLHRRKANLFKIILVCEEDPRSDDSGLKRCCQSLDNRSEWLRCVLRGEDALARRTRFFL